MNSKLCQRMSLGFIIILGLITAIMFSYSAYIDTRNGTETVISNTYLIVAGIIIITTIVSVAGINVNFDLANKKATIEHIKQEDIK